MRCRLADSGRTLRRIFSRASFRHRQNTWFFDSQIRWGTTAEKSSSVFTLQVAQSTDWSPGDVRSVLEQVAEEGCLEKELHVRLHGGSANDSGDSNASSSADELVVADAETSVSCGIPDVLLALELCRTSRIRDYVSLAKLADRLVPEVPSASMVELVHLSSRFAALGALNQPLFDAIAKSFLTSWQPGDCLESGSLVQVARAFASQRSRHVELFDRLSSMLDASVVSTLKPSEALSLLHSLAFLRLDVHCGEDLWLRLERCALEPGLQVLGPGPVSELCHILFLSGRASSRLAEISTMIEAIAAPVLALEDSFWKAGEGLSIHWRLLMLRSCLRYLHRDTYHALSSDATRALRRVYRMEMPLREPRPSVSFVRKLSHILTKIKVGHMCDVEKGPLVFDVIERDRKLVYECNHFDRFYIGSTAKIASSCLQERIVKAMGYRVVQIPHWQWNKVKHKKQRVEYVRMSRYYAIKDRREFGPRDEQPADVASNQFDYFGEYFFRKEAPSSAWSWYQPRYDGTKRLRERPSL